METKEIVEVLIKIVNIHQKVLKELEETINKLIQINDFLIIYNPHLNKNEKIRNLQKELENFSEIKKEKQDEEICI